MIYEKHFDHKNQIDIFYLVFSHNAYQQHTFTDKHDTVSKYLYVKN